MKTILLLIVALLGACGVDDSRDIEPDAGETDVRHDVLRSDAAAHDGPDGPNRVIDQCGVCDMVWVCPSGLPCDMTSTTTLCPDGVCRPVGLHAVGAPLDRSARDGVQLCKGLECLYPADCEI